MSRAEQIQRLFNEIVDLDPNARVAYLDQACSDDAIRREVESLLAAYDERATKVRSRRRPGVLAIQFPPLQTTLLEAVELMIQPQGPEFEQVLDLVERDPGVATRLLHMANSAYYGQRRPVSNIHRAVMVMGTVPVTEMVLGLSLQQVPLDRPARLASAHLMRHSMATAFLARHLLARDPAPPRGQPGRKKRQREVFTAALLHDIGKLVLLYNYPGAASAFYRAASDSSKPDAEVLAQERALFGYDHGAAGGYLSERLHFPEVLTAAIAWHHRYGQLSPRKEVLKQAVYPVAGANKAANALGHAFNHGTTREACFADPVWALLLEENVLGYSNPEAILAEVVAVEGELAAYVEAAV